MAFCNIRDLNLEILSWVYDLKLFTDLSILDKKSYILIVNTSIYKELNILKNHNTKMGEYDIINKYCKFGLINILKKLKKNNKCFISNAVIDLASEYGHINMLEWFKNSGLEFEYTENAIDHASANGHIDILKWFKKSGLEFKYTKVGNRLGIKKWSRKYIRMV